MFEVLKAQQILEEKFGVGADVWSVTSYKELYRDANDSERWNMLSFRTLLVSVLFLAACTLSPAQSITEVLQPAPSASGPTDPLGRNTPSNSVLGFLKAATAGDYSIAAQYLQMSAARRQSEGEQTAEKLKFVLDKAFTGNYGRFSQPEGTPQEGVALGHQKLGSMHVEGTVELLATISKEGNITHIKVVSGDAQLARAASDAVKQWKYKPYLLNGEPLEIQTGVTVNFKLPH